MRKVICILVLLMAAACSEQQSSSTPSPADSSEMASPGDSAELMQWFEERYEENLQFSPIQMTFLGRKTRYDQIDDFSLAAYNERVAWRQKTVETLKSRFDYESLSDTDKMSYDLWVYIADIEKQEQAFPYHDYIFEQMDGAHSFLPTFLISFHKVENVSDMRAYTARIEGIARAINQLVAHAQEAANKSIRPPRFAYEIVKGEVNKIIDGVPFVYPGKDSPIWADAKKKIHELLKSHDISEKESTLFFRNVKVALNEHLLPAYQNILSFIDGDIANTSDAAKGVYALPNGADYYNFRLREMTTTNMSADQIHALGLSEVARLRKQMNTIKNKAGFKGDLQAFFKFIRESRDDMRLYYPETDEGRQAYIDDAGAAIDNIETQLPKYFGILPKADLVVKRVEAFREQPGAAQHYYPGTPDGSRPGIYYAHLSDMSAMPKNQLEVIAYHEGLPGHHMQISIAQELQSVPTFRKQVNFTAYTEGWALYSEHLASEMPGTYKDVYSEFGRLSSEIWRAIRLVVDTGLHAKVWSEQQAIDYFKENSPEPISGIRSEVKRYLVLPGQATSYKIGMLDILRLREKAKKALGSDYDIRDFHDAVLGGGALPLTLLEKRVDQWIASQQRK